MYSQSYYGGEQTVISATDGTMGGSTLQSSRFSSGGSILGSTVAGQSLFDEQSFEAYRNQGRARKEEVIEIYAPAGKLGVVIDTPNTGAPILHRIKETCPIADKLQVGDRLIAVDDEDVRSMTAVKVSKLISQKSANPTRKFTIVRSL
jgi:C-terminal processing protease CtpA/Prc